MATLKDFPLEERPREKAYRYGVESLSNQELVALLIGSGSEGNSALNIANNLLLDSFGLSGLIKRDYHEFLKYKGLKKARAMVLAAAFEIGKRYQINTMEKEEFLTSETLFRKYEPIISNYDYEVLIIVTLNRRKKVIHEETISRGSTRNIHFSFHSIFKSILSRDGHYFYLIHNHPSGETNPSNDDIKLTYDIEQQARKIGLSLVDHIIIGNGDYYSFLENEQRMPKITKERIIKTM